MADDQQSENAVEPARSEARSPVGPRDGVDRVVVGLGGAMLQDAVEGARSGISLVGLISIMVLVGLIAVVLSSLLAFVAAGLLSMLLTSIGAGDEVVGPAFGAILLVGTLGPALLIMLVVYRRLPKPLRKLGSEDAAQAAGLSAPPPWQRGLKQLGTVAGFVVGSAAFYGLAILIGDGPFLLFGVPAVIGFVGALSLDQPPRAPLIRGGAEGFAGACMMSLLFGLLAWAAGD